MQKPLISRIFKVTSTYTTLCLEQMSQYTHSGHTATGTLNQNITGESPMRTMLSLKSNKHPKKLPLMVKQTQLQNDYIKPGSYNHTLLKGPTNAFNLLYGVQPKVGASGLKCLPLLHTNQLECRCGILHADYDLDPGNAYPYKAH